MASNIFDHEKHNYPFGKRDFHNISSFVDTKHRIFAFVLLRILLFDAKLGSQKIYFTDRVFHHLPFAGTNYCGTVDERTV